MDNHDDQQDLFQGYCQLWKSILLETKVSFPTWMYQVAINTAIVFLKKEKIDK
jgi:RNA polymerase sigma-70 factor (ECF subfamily)